MQMNGLVSQKWKQKASEDRRAKEEMGRKEEPGVKSLRFQGGR